MLLKRSPVVTCRRVVRVRVRYESLWWLLGWAAWLPRFVFRIESVHPARPLIFSGRLVWDLSQWSL